jgi:hypothetical protein
MRCTRHAKEVSMTRSASPLPTRRSLAGPLRRGAGARVLARGASCVLGAALALACVFGVRVSDAAAADRDVRLLVGTPWDVNDFGQIVREDDVAVPGEVVRSLGINNAGQIVGSLGSHGFVKTGASAPVAFDIAGASSTVANRINNLGQVIGFYETSLVPGQFKGFLRQPNGSITVVEFPGADSTFPLGINDAGVIVGRYVVNNRFLAFVRDASGYRTLTTPADGCDARDIDNVGRIIGACGAGQNPQNNAGFSYLKHGTGDAVRVDILTFGSAYTFALGMNNRSHVTGVLSSDVGQPEQGFLASPGDTPLLDFEGDGKADESRSPGQWRFG